MESARCKAFLESVEKGSFMAAAESLGYTPSGVSQLVSALEKELDLKLLIRSKKGVTPTDDGKALISIIRSYLARERDLYQMASELHGLSTGELTIAVYPSIAITWLPEIVREFQKDYPGINFNIKEGIRQEIFSYLDENTADMGFMAHTDPMDYEWISLYDDEMLAVIPTDHPMANAKSYPVKLCENDNFIMTSWGDDAEVIDIFKRSNVEANIRYTTYDTPATVAMVRMGMGVGFANELSVTYWNDDIVKLPLEPKEFVTFGIAYNSQENMSTAARAFLNFSVDFIKAKHQA